MSSAAREEQESGGRARLPRFLLLLLTLAALGQRFVGLDFLLPHMLEPDGVYLQVELVGQELVPEESQVNLTSYPHLYPWIVRLLRGRSRAPERPAANLAGELRSAAEPVLDTRRVGALLATLLVPLTYALARRFLGRWEALLAAAFTATSLLHVSLSQQGRPHAPAASFALLAVLAATRLCRRKGWGDYLLAGGAAALAVGALQSGPCVLLSGVVAHGLRARPRRAREHWLLLVPLACLLASLLCFYPYVFHTPPGREVELAVVDGKVNLGGRPMHLGMWDGQGWRAIAWILWSYDPVLLGAASLGLTLLLASPRGARDAREPRRAEAWVVLAYALPYLLVWGMYRYTFERALLQLVPYLALLAAWFCARLGRGLARFGGSGRVARLLTLAPALAALALPTYASLRLVVLRAQPDTVEELTAWIEANVPEPARPLRIADSLELPLWLSDEARAGHSRRYRDRRVHAWFTHQGRLPAAAHAPAWPLFPFDYLAMGLFQPQAKRIPEQARALKPELRVFLIAANSVEYAGPRALREQSARLGGRKLVFAAYEDEALGPVALCHQQPGGATYGFLWTTLHARAVGPALELHLPWKYH